MKVNDSIMEKLAFSSQPQQITFILTCISQNPKDSDPWLVGMVARETARALRKDGYMVEPESTGNRGIVNFIVEAFTTLEQIPSELWMHKDVVEFIATLCTIFQSVIPAAKHLKEACSHWANRNKTKYRTQNTGQAEAHIKITAEIEGTPITIETHELESTQTALLALKMAQRFHAMHPDIKVTPQSKVRLTGSVEKRQPLKRAKRV